MKNFLFLILLCPILVFGQEAGETLIFEIGTIKISPKDAARVESGMAAHNKKYHASGHSGARVYVVSNGRESGAYKWVMGPAPWSALDHRPSDDAHNSDWQENVAQYMLPDGNNEYIRFDASLSRFPKDFKLNKLWVQHVNVARGKMDMAKEILKKIHKVYVDKLPDDIYGVYFNELPNTTDGRDLSIVAYFDRYAWMAEDNGFAERYDEVYGKGSLDAMWKEWMDITEGVETEIWEFREDLSGLSSEVKVAERQ